MRTDYCTFWRQGLGLTQTCHQIRKEFLLIFTKHCPMNIDLEHVVQYVEDFIRLPGQPDDRTMAKHSPHDPVQSGLSADMRDIMLLHAIAPRFAIKLEWPCAGDDALLEVSAGSTWHEHLLQCASKLEWTMRDDGECEGVCGRMLHDIDTTRYVKPEVAKDWMWSPKLGPEFDDTSSAWTRSLGYQGRRRCGCVDEGSVR
jgi:hypothetical protein